MRRFSFFLFFAVMAMSCSREVLVEPETPSAEIGESVFVPGEVVVKFTDEMIDAIESDLVSGSVRTKSSELNGITELIGVKSMRRMFPDAGEFEARTRKAGLHRWYIVEYDPSVGMTKASGNLSSVPGIEIVEPIFRTKSTAVFNDPLYPQQWHYYNDGTLTSQHKSGADINVVPVWENYTTGSENVIVAVVDGGVDQNHEDLKDNLIGGKNYVSGGAIKPHDHGTHVAGTVAAVNNNGKGVSGIAGGDAARGVKGVKIWSAQIFEHDPNNPGKDIGTNNSYAALKAGADNGAVISQNSWGASFETREDMEEARKYGIPDYAKDAVDYFIENAGCDASGNQRPDSPMKGGVVIFAAGNDGWDWAIPGAYEPVIAVGSIAPDFTRAYYSNFGDWVDIAAPGGSYKYTKGQVYSTMPDNGYGEMQGTSMACPHVSGVAALLVSHFGGLGFTNEMLVKKLLGGANSSVLSSNTQIGPLLDAQGAFAFGGTKPPLIPSPSSLAKSNNIEFTWKVTSDPDDKKAYGYIMVAAKERQLFDNLDLNNPPAGVNTSRILVGDLKVGDEMTGRLEDLEFEQTYYVAVSAYDYNKNFSALSAIQTVRTTQNNAPVISTGYDGDFKIKSHEIVNVEYDVSDPDGHTFSISLNPGSEALSGEISPVDDGKYTLTFVGNADEPGKYTAEIIVTDKYGASTTETVGYEIMDNHAPAIVKDIEDRMLSMIGERFSLDMAEYLEDPDGEQLKFEVQISDRSVLHINPSGNTLHATALSYGLVDVVIIAKDSRDLSCKLPFKVLIKDMERPLELYPNPVTDVLNVRTMDDMETVITIISSTGKVVYESVSVVGAFHPASVDMSACAPGKYSVKVSFGGEEFVRTVVKI